MRKCFVFNLIFFLSFFIQLASGLSIGQCRYYVNNICQTGGGYLYIPEEIIETVGETRIIVEPPSLALLTFQFLGIIVLVVLLVIVAQELFKSLEKKPKKTRKR